MAVTLLCLKALGQKEQARTLEGTPQFLLLVDGLPPLIEGLVALGIGGTAAHLALVSLDGGTNQHCLKRPSFLRTHSTARVNN